MQAQVPNNGKAPYTSASGTVRTATLHEDFEKSLKATQVCNSHALISLS